jgi:hypothetical protein
MGAQLVHAAGESAQNVTLPPHTHAVCLSVPHEAALLRLAEQLEANGISFILIREPDAPWNMAAMAIGLPPQPKTKELVGVLKRYPLLK